MLTPIWKFFASVKLTVVLLLSLAVTSIIGTVIPQNESPAAYFHAYGEFLYRMFDVLNIFDMYHSWWFQLLAILLTANIVVCSIERLSATWKIIFARNPSFNVSRFRKQPGGHTFTDSRTPEQLRGACERIAAGGYGYVRIEPAEDGFRMFAEKWRWTRIGVYVVHLSVVVLFAGALIGSFFGFDGFVSIPEGETVDHIQLRNSNQPQQLGFAIRCDDFSVSFYATGQPKEYRSSLTLIQDGREVFKKDIIVNDPIRYGGINIFQASYGELEPEPQAAAPAAAPDAVTLTFTAAATGMVYTETMAMGQHVELPEGAGTFVLREHKPAAAFMGQNIGEALIGVLTPPQGEAVEVLLPLRFPNFDKMRQGDVVISVSGQKAQKFVPGALSTPEPRYFTGLQVTKDPGIWLVYAGFVLMIAGCFITFFMNHQQLCIDVGGKGDGSQVMVAGVANRNRQAMQRKIDLIVGRLKAGRDG